MKILVRYFSDKNKFRIIEVELSEQMKLNDMVKAIVLAVKEDIVLLPLKMIERNDSLNLASYLKSVENEASQYGYHFNALSRHQLSDNENTILSNLKLEISADPKIQSKQIDDITSAQEFIHFLCQILPSEVKKSLVVRLTDNVNMFGETYHDTVTQEAKQMEARYSMQVHPYPALAAGASNVIVHENIFNELSVVLVYNQQRDKRSAVDPLRHAGVPDFWKLPEGYMHPKPCKGGEQGIALMSSDDMNQAEELMLKNKLMPEAYRTVRENNENKENKEEPPLKDSSGSYDRSVKHCGIRESFEEVGLSMSMDQVHFVSQYEATRAIHMLANIYLMKPKSRSLALPTLRVDGKEIKEGIWGKLRAFRFVKDPTKPAKICITVDYYDKEANVYAVEVPYNYALIIGKAIKKYRDDEIQKNSKMAGYSLFNSTENVVARILQILAIPALNVNHITLQDILGATPENYLADLGASDPSGETESEKTENLTALAQLGKKAQDYHRKISVLIKAFSQSPKLLNAQQLQGIANEGAEIESHLLVGQSKLRFFVLHGVDSIEKRDAMVAPVFC